MKVFQIGFNRCGTTSIYELFDKIPKVHYWLLDSEVNIPELKDDAISLTYFNGVKDSRKYILLADIIKFNKERNLDLLYGIDSKYVLFCDMENVEQDYYSHVEDFKALDKQYPGSKFILNTRNIDSWIESRVKHDNYLEICKEYHGIDNDSILNLWRDRWYDHHNNVKNYFKDRDNLLVFNIEEDDVEKLINFLPEYSLNKGKWIRYNKSFK